MSVPNNRRCYHCGTRQAPTSQETIWGFKVRLCDQCFQDFLKLLGKFCQNRPDPFAAERQRGGRL
jgi:hypothetical protein